MFGSGNGTTTYSENIGTLGTGVAGMSRRLKTFRDTVPYQPLIRNHAGRIPKDDASNCNFSYISWHVHKICSFFRYYA